MTRTASDPRRGGWFGGVVAALLLGAGVAGAQQVTLRIAPPVGETMRMRLDQRVEMSGTSRLPSGDSTAVMVTTLLVISRTFVERRDRAATILLATADSVSATSTGADSLRIGPELRRSLQGRRVRLRIAPDGSTEVIGGDEAGSAELNALFSQMPATLPSGPVTVGKRWSRVMLAPLGAGPAGKGGGKLEATFTLDSLSSDGDRAFVSLVGRLTRPPSQKDGWATLSLTGSMTGALVIDRRRGWIGDARMTYVVQSVVTPTDNGSAVVRFRMKVTQWMRALQ